MIGDLLINGLDAYATWGVMMDDKFIEALYAPAALKDFITNEVRGEHGTRYADGQKAYYKARDLTLTFRINGKSIADRLQKRKAFLEVMLSGEITLQVRDDSEVYHLRYTGYSSSYGINLARTSECIPMKFIEPDPTNR